MYNVKFTKQLFILNLGSEDSAFARVMLVPTIVLVLSETLFLRHLYISAGDYQSNQPLCKLLLANNSVRAYLISISQDNIFLLK